MKIEERKKLYLEALKKWRTEMQLVMVQEECSELIKAVCKFFRHGTHALDNLAEEVADVEIMLEQTKMMFGERVDGVMVYPFAGLVGKFL